MISKSTLYNYKANSIALNDFMAGIKNWPVWWNMAQFAIKARFRRTVIGPFWITLSLAIWITFLSIVNSYLFKISITSQLPGLIVGMIFWTLVTSLLNEGCMAIIAHEGLIKNLPGSIMNYILNVVAQNAIICLFNMLLYPIVFLFIVHKINIHFMLFIPGIIIFLLNMLWITIVLAIISTRFRDLPRMINSFTQVLFFVTPVFWSPNKDELPFFISINPLYHLLEIVRAPLIGEMINYTSWMVTITLAIVGISFAVWLYNRTFLMLKLWL